jgi:ABC-type dipeptide/oligopeptide/nickel transport system permease component
MSGSPSSGIPIGPNRTFLLGTDSLGRDVLVRIAYGTRVSLLVGVLASALAVLVGTLVGIVAGWYGGLVDRALSRLMDVVLSLPFLVFALALVAVVGPSLTISVTVIAFFTWASVGRVVRAQALSIRELEYVQAARTLGASHARIMFIEILPNVTASVIVYTTLLIPGAISRRGDALVSRPQRRAADALVGQHAGRRHGLLQGGVVVRVLSWRGAAHHDRRVQRAWRQRARRARPAPRHGLARQSGGRGMIRFLLRRLAWSALVVWVVATTVFVIYFAVPRDVARLIAGRQASEQTIQIVRARLGLTSPWASSTSRSCDDWPRRSGGIVSHAGAGDRDRSARLSGHRLARPRQRGAVAGDGSSAPA